MSETDARVHEARRQFWRSNLRLMLFLLAIWAFAGLGCGVLFADWLDQWSIGGFPLGFWFAQQGSILVFVVLILVYAIAMARLDARYRKAVHAARQEHAG